MYNNVVPYWSAVSISFNHSIPRLISFTKKRFKSEINSFCIWTQRYQPSHSLIFTQTSFLTHVFTTKKHLRKVNFKKCCDISYHFRLCRSFVVNLFIFYNLGFPRDILLIVYTSHVPVGYMYIFENEV
jgi:hypothetical protein